MPPHRKQPKRHQGDSKGLAGGTKPQTPGLEASLPSSPPPVPGRLTVSSWIQRGFGYWVSSGARFCIRRTANSYLLTDATKPAKKKEYRSFEEAAARASDILNI